MKTKPQISPTEIPALKNTTYDIFQQEQYF